MDKSKSQQEQVQAIYLAQANIFTYEATAKSWVPLCDSAVPISILYDNTRSIYRIISVDAGIKEVMVNTTILPQLEFVKTTQKFGYWKDIPSSRTFGIGFASEFEADSFDECLKKVKQSLTGNNNVSNNASLTSSKKSLNHLEMEKAEKPVPALDGQGDCPTSFEKKLSWSNYEELSGPVLSFLQSHRNHFTLPTPNTGDNTRPATYNVNLPTISSTSSNEMSQQHQVPTSSAGAYPIPLYCLEKLVSASNTSQQQQRLHGYCYQGPPPQITPMTPNPSAAIMAATTASSCDSKITSNTTKAPFSNQRNELLEEISRIRSENARLSQSLIGSVCAAKNLEVQMSSLRDDNVNLVKSIAELNTRLESLSKQALDKNEEANRWKDQYQRVVSDSKEKSHFLEETEAKLKCTSAEKARIESIMKNLEDELRKQMKINKEQQNSVTGQFTNKYFKELEDHYRKLLSDSQKRIEEVLRKDGDRKNVLRGVDTLFTGAIQGLINIHGQIRQSYEQQ